jgi:hypothetical protein
MGQVYQCWWRPCREMNVFSSFEYHMFYVLYQFVTCLLTINFVTNFYVSLCYYIVILRITHKD